MNYIADSTDSMVTIAIMAFKLLQSKIFSEVQLILSQLCFALLLGVDDTIASSVKMVILPSYALKHI